MTDGPKVTGRPSDADFIKGWNEGTPQPVLAARWNYRSRKSISYRAKRLGLTPRIPGQKPYAPNDKLLAMVEAGASKAKIAEAFGYSKIDHVRRRLSVIRGTMNSKEKGTK